MPELPGFLAFMSSSWVFPDFARIFPAIRAKLGQTGASVTGSTTIGYRILAA